MVRGHPGTPWSQKLHNKPQTLLSALVLSRSQDLEAMFAFLKDAAPPAPRQLPTSFGTKTR